MSKKKENSKYKITEMYDDKNNLITTITPSSGVINTYTYPYTVPGINSSSPITYQYTPQTDSESELETLDKIAKIHRVSFLKEILDKFSVCKKITDVYKFMDELEKEYKILLDEKVIF